jgi:hypothetical protein
MQGLHAANWRLRYFEINFLSVNATLYIGLSDICYFSQIYGIRKNDLYNYGTLCGYL